MNADALVSHDVTVTVIAPGKPRYVCGFEPGDLVEVNRPLKPYSGDGPSIIPRYSVGLITRRSANMALVKFLFFGDRWVDLDDLDFALPVMLAPNRLAETREGDATC